jgi:hypothetical protein
MIVRLKGKEGGDLKSIVVSVCSKRKRRKRKEKRRKEKEKI